MSARPEAHHLLAIAEVRTALVVLTLELRRIDQHFG
jgi:hypothetical protein